LEEKGSQTRKSLSFKNKKSRSISGLVFFQMRKKEKKTFRVVMAGGKVGARGKENAGMVKK